MPTVMSKPIVKICEPINNNTMREMLPDPQKDSYNFIKGIYNILNQSFEEIKIDNHNNFQLKFSVSKGDDEFVYLLLRIIDIYCDCKGFIHPTKTDIINGEECNRIIIECSNWKNMPLEF
tara:strand:+ start:53 stop:412 length:360 start_codon:yes stop_codon:yes gene_type:complete